MSGRQLRGIAGIDGRAADDADVAERVRAELIDKISATLGLGGAVAAPAAAAGEVAAAPEAGGFEPVWIETPECTACDECTTLAPKVFAYNEQKLAVVINPKGGRFADIVKAAEKCTAGCIHPGTPWNPAEPGLDKLVARAAKYN